MIAHVAFGVTLQLVLDVSVHAFVSSAILRIVRTYPFQIDTHSQPPCRQLAKAQIRVGSGEGCAIVAADMTWKAMALKELIKTATYLFATAI